MSKAIRAIQAQLQLDNYYKGSLDGLYGNLTDTAIRQSIDNKKFKVYFNFNKYKSLFNKDSVDQKFVDSINGLFQVFNEYNTEGGTNLLNVSYLLASVHHETNQTFLPLREYGKGKGKPYGSNIDIDGSRYTGLDHIYYGRGYIQITWLTNYIKLGKLLNIDLVNDPDLALDPVVAAKILVVGCLRGLFTGKSLSDYLRSGSRLEFIRARKVINGVDRSEDIADYAVKFLECLILTKI